MTSFNDKRIFGLDLMRAAAILMVLIGHCTWILPQSNEALSILLAFSGYFGVEVFFVLSGFLIGRILYGEFSTGPFTVKTAIKFLKRRWFRTLPNYYFALLLNLLIASFIGYKAESYGRYLIFAQNFASPMRPFFPESWSLSVEEFAYLLLPVTFLAVALINGRRSSQFLCAVLLLIGICFCLKFSFHISHHSITLETWARELKMVVIYRLDAILIGVVFSWFYSNYALLWTRLKLPFAAIGLLMIAFLLFGVGKFQLLIAQYPLFWNVFYLPLTSMTVAFFLPVLSEWKSARGLVPKAIAFTSIISYSIYLLHYGIVLQLMKYFLPLGSGSIEQLAGFIIIYIFLTFALSWLLYRYFERRMTALRDKW